MGSLATSPVHQLCPACSCCLVIYGVHHSRLGGIYCQHSQPKSSRMSLRMGGLETDSPCSMMQQRCYTAGSYRYLPQTIPWRVQEGPPDRRVVSCSLLSGQPGWRLRYPTQEANEVCRATIPQPGVLLLVNILLLRSYLERDLFKMRAAALFLQQEIF